MSRKQADSWRAINRVLKDLTEDQVAQMLDAEMSGQRRVVVVERLHQRLCAMRSSRERLELMKEIQKRGFTESIASTASAA